MHPRPPLRTPLSNIVRPQPCKVVKVVQAPLFTSSVLKSCQGSKFLHVPACSYKMLADPLFFMLHLAKRWHDSHESHSSHGSQRPDSVRVPMIPTGSQWFPVVPRVQAHLSLSKLQTRVLRLATR